MHVNILNVALLHITLGRSLTFSRYESKTFHLDFLNNASILVLVFRRLALIGSIPLKYIINNDFLDS
jgi:hypothetical protein